MRGANPFRSAGKTSLEAAPEMTLGTASPVNALLVFGLIFAPTVFGWYILFRPYRTTLKLATVVAMLLEVTAFAVNAAPDLGGVVGLVEAFRSLL